LGTSVSPCRVGELRPARPSAGLGLSLAAQTYVNAEMAKENKMKNRRAVAAGQPEPRITTGSVHPEDNK